MCANLNDHTYTQCFMLIVKDMVTMRLVAIGYEYVMLP